MALDEPYAKLIAPPSRAAVLFMNLEFLTVPFEAPKSNPIAPPRPVFHVLSLLLTFLGSLYVLFAIPKARLFSKVHNANNVFLEHIGYSYDIGLVLGRLATEVATILRGKHKPTFTPHVDCGDFVIVVNASKINLTGNKLDDKIYYNHSGYTGGLRQRTARVMKESYPVEMMERAIKGMLPKGRLGRQMFTKLYVYEGSEHNQVAQQPKALEV